MIVTVEEVREAKGLLQKAKDALRARNLPFRDEVPVGIMVETPAAVLLSDQLAKEASFFSIGTNDLIQYTTATDRMNEKVQYLYTPYNLSVLRSIRLVIENAHKAEIPVGMCGEMASNENFTSLLLGMGLDEFSVAPSLAGKTKYCVCNSEYPAGFADAVLACDTVERAKEILQRSSCLKPPDGAEA